LLVARYLASQQAVIQALQVELDAASASQTELEEEQSGDDGVFAGFDSVNTAAVKERIREIGNDHDSVGELKLLKNWLDLGARIAALKKQVKDAELALDVLAYEKYPTLTKTDIQSLVIDDKWMARLSASVQGELDRFSQTLTGRIRQLAERYATPLPQLTQEVAALAARVEQHLKKMGAVWS
jgi:type I restriction enzyme M protein